MVIGVYKERLAYELSPIYIAHRDRNVITEDLILLSEPRKENKWYKSREGCPTPRQELQPVSIMDSVSLNELRDLRISNWMNISACAVRLTSLGLP